MKLRRAWIVLALVPVVLLAGCPHGNDAAAAMSNAGSASPILDHVLPGLPGALQDDLVSMCEAVHESRCGALRDFHAGSVAYDECVAEGVAECTEYFLRDYAGAFREGRVVYDAAALRTCLDEVHERYLESDTRIRWLPVWRDLHREIESCKHVFTGTVANGDLCYWPETYDFLGINECAAGYCSFEDREICPSKCVPYLKVGDPCMYGVGGPCEPGADCYDNSHCAREAEVFPALGEACTPGGVSCANGRLTCLAENGGDPMCVPLRKLGESCEEERDCAAGGCIAKRCELGEDGDPCSTDAACRDDLVCRASGACGARAAANEECMRDAQCERELYCAGGWNIGHCKDGSIGTSCCPIGGTDCGAGCREGLVCDHNANCRAPGGEGDACDATAPEYVALCLPGLFCSSAGTCQRTALGQACSDATECGLDAYFYCDGGTCKQRKLPGSACADGMECTGGGCQRGICSRSCQDY